MENQLSSPKINSLAAYGGAFLFTVLIILFNTVPAFYGVHIVAVAFHIILFPVVAALPSKDWAKAAGYGWLVLDIAASVMMINGVDEQITTALRYSAHIPAVIWIISASLKGNRIMQIVGVLQGIIMGSYSFVAPWAPKEMLYPAMILLIIWLILVGRSFQHSGVKN